MYVYGHNAASDVRDEFFFVTERRIAESTLFPYTTLFRSLRKPLPTGVVIGPLRPIFVSLIESITDRKSTRLNSSHVEISYAVFCLKKKTIMVICMLTAIRLLLTFVMSLYMLLRS